MEQKFTPDDGHIHQHLDGQCTWCGAPLTAVVSDKMDRTITEVTETVMEFNEAVTLNHEGVIVATHEKFMVAVLTDKAIKSFATEAVRVLAWAKTLEITGGTTAKKVAGDLRSISILRRNVDARKKELLAPLSDALKQMKVDIATIEAPLAEADMIGRTKVTQWDAQQKKIQRDAEEATRLAAQAAEAARKVTDAGGEAPDLSEIPIVDVPADRGPLRPDSGGTVSMVDHWSAEVTDKQSIPGEYMEPNMQMLNMLARQRKGSDPIPGVKWVNNPTPSVR